MGLTFEDLLLLPTILDEVAKELDDTYYDNEPYFRVEHSAFDLAGTKYSYTDRLVKYLFLLSHSQNESEFWGRKNIYFISEEDGQLLETTATKTELIEMPMYINYESLYIRGVAIWRLQIGK